MEDKRLFLVDAYAFIYRAYYALIRAPRINSKGFNTSAIFGFCNSLDEILRKENPSHIAVCFDPKGGTFRHEAYPEYKAQREAQPEDISRAVPYIKDIIAAHNIPIIEVPNYEADDVIGTLARRAEAEGYTTYMMTPDKDYAQLVTANTFMYRPALKGNGFEIRGVEQICERYGISRPAQVIDLLALEGDASDNIPGCPGVGEKTAIKLISEWGSVENLLANTDSIKGALQKKILDNAEKIRFSKFLVTIKTDVPVECSIESLVRKEDNVDLLRKIYSELEFKTFISRLDSSATTITAPTSLQPAQDFMPSLFDSPDEPTTHAASADTSFNASIQHYSSTADISTVEAIIASATASSIVGVSIYATGNDAMTAQLTGLALSASEGNATYIPIPTDSGSRIRTIAALQCLFSSHSTTIVSHDVKRDYIILKNNGIVFSAPYYDTSVAHYLLQPEMRHTLSHVAFTLLRYRTFDYGDNSRAKNDSSSLDPQDAINRFCEAADITRRLHPILENELKQNGLTSLLSDIELPFIRVLAEMEYSGVRIDSDELASLSKRLSSRLHDMEHEVHNLAGGEFNVASPMQVGEVLFGRLKIDSKAKRTAKGSYSTTEEVLEKYRSSYPIVDLILKIRGLRKLLTTYINALPELVNRKTGKIHTSYNQTVTATGRLSSSNPNLQNIPIRTDDGREIRKAFIADPDCILLSADYSQIELRVIADLSGDKDMIDAFISGADIHQATAAKIYNIPIEDVTAEQRRKAKTANFGIIYGISAFGLSERLGIPRAEAKMLINGYFDSYPKVREYMELSIENARNLGYVSTIKGRKRMLPDINSRNAVVRGYAERNAINAPIQGSAADIIKIAMIDISREFEMKGILSRMIMQVHDELVFNVIPDELESVKEIVIRNMENAYHGQVPLIVSAGTGTNWLEAH